MPSEELIKLVLDNVHLVWVSCFGGIVLFGLKVTEYVIRAPEDKSTPLRAFFVHTLLLICLPVLGAGVSIIYILNGDKMGAVLAFQVGLTSPAIVQSMIIAAANRAASDPVKIKEGA
jgi:hypothetical protein